MSVSILPVILSGGSGTRLWPLSRRAYPKQFISFSGGQSLLQQTCRRLEADLFDAPLILGNQHHRFIAAEQLLEIGVEPSAIVLEPAGRNTAPAAITSALIAAREDENRLVLLLPSDHVVADGDGFAQSIKMGMEAAGNGHIVTFGVRPESPETGYGYIEVSGKDTDAYDVVRFIEKPPLEKAQSYLDAGHFFWNAGIFLFSAKGMIAAFEKHAPDILEACKTALDNAVHDLDFLRLEKASYETCENISLDYAIMEKADKVKCVPLISDWSDLGSWSAIWQLKEKDGQGNASEGNVILHDTHNSYAHSADNAHLVLVGLEDVMAIATKDAILVAAKSYSQDVKLIVDQLEAKECGNAVYHTRVYRPWGWYEGLEQGHHYQVKCLMVKPGAQLSLQSHKFRAEHWIVVSGEAKVTVGEEVSLLKENQNTYIPIGEKHRLENPGKTPLIIVEVQSGSYLGEDDIVRYDNKYNKAGRL